MRRLNITVKVQNSRRIDPANTLVWGVIIAPMGYEGRVVEVQASIPMDVELGVRQWLEGAVAEPGSMLLFHQAVETGVVSQDQHPIWLARAVTHFGIEPARAVVHAYCRVAVMPGDERFNKGHAHMDILHTKDARLLRDSDDLWGFYQEFMDGSIKGVENNANSVIRLINTRTGRIKTTWLYCARQTVNLPPARPGMPPRRFTLPAPVERTWDESITRGMQAKGYLRVLATALGEKVPGMTEDHLRMANELQVDLQASRILMEAVPGQRIRILGFSLERLLQGSETRLGRVAEQCLVTNKAGELVPAFLEMTVGLMRSPPTNGANQNDTVVVANFVPTSRRAVPCDVDRLPTANFDPLAVPAPA